MKSGWLRSLLLLSFLSVSFCGGGDSAAPVDTADPDPLPLGFAAELTCFTDSLTDARSAVFGMIALYRKLQDPGYTAPAPNSVALDLGFDPATFDVEWDADGDGSVAETHLSGELAPNQDPGDGLDILEFVDVAWDFEVSGVETGFGDFRLTRISQDQVRLVGSADFPSDGCRFEITSMDLELSDSQAIGAVPDGDLNFRTNDGAMIGLITFAPPSTIAQIAVSYDGQILEFGFDLDSGQPVFE